MLRKYDRGPGLYLLSSVDVIIWDRDTGKYLHKLRCDIWVTRALTIRPTRMYLHKYLNDDIIKLVCIP